MNYKTMTIQELQQQFDNVGRVPRKLLAGGTYGVKSRQEMIATLTRWQKQDEAAEVRNANND